LFSSKTLNAIQVTCASAALARDVAKFWSGTTEKSNPEKLTFTETGSVTTVLLSSDEQENRCATNKGSNKKKNFCIDLINLMLQS
ncbi:MAG: hypothetical protein MR898_01335, partial [Prevotella sp.]|nr:hypothetical protein [Prevotella sp.]